jgi:trehalose 6-phosphate phosphatase
VTGLPAPLQTLATDPGHGAVFLDFDGTLAPIVADPAAARPLPGVRPLLARLAQHFDVVAVISGRPVGFLAEHLGTPPGLLLFGLYGLESFDEDGGLATAGEIERWRPAVRGVVERAQAEAPQGVRVEDKGLTFTLHWRADPSLEPWVRRFADEVASAAGLSARAARLSLEFGPPLSVDKGTVVASLAPGHRAAACFGDDLGDLPAFAALRSLESAMGVTLVAVVDAESAPEVAAAADVVVEGPTGALELLKALTS